MSCLFCCVFFVVVVLFVWKHFNLFLFTMQIEFERRVSATRLWYFVELCIKLSRFLFTGSVLLEAGE